MLASAIKRMGGSQLSQLKAALQTGGLARNNGQSKKNRSNGSTAKDRISGDVEARKRKLEVCLATLQCTKVSKLRLEYFG